LLELSVGVFFFQDEESFSEAVVDNVPPRRMRASGSTRSLQGMVAECVRVSRSTVRCR
jgi:hypothetical protein